MMKEDLFENQRPDVVLAPGAFFFPGFAKQKAEALITEVNKITAVVPFRNMTTPGGFTMSVGMTNCGKYGWITDKYGYRYITINPANGEAWPTIPDIFMELAKSAALKAGYENYIPDACLMNCYEQGAKMSLHQDKNEKDYSAPIVSVSLGLPATFLFGGLEKTDPQKRVSLIHGDVVVWGGESRLFYHGILPLKKGYHDLLGPKRINLTFRKVGY